MALATILEQQVNVQLGGDRVTWSYTASAIRAETRTVLMVHANMQTMYSRLARQYDARPAVRDTNGGVPGDKFPL
jgi:hypothetical protein